MTVIIINRHACPLIASFSNHRQNLEIDMFQVENHVQNHVCFFLYIILFSKHAISNGLIHKGFPKHQTTLMFIPLKMVLIGIDPYPYIYIYIGTSYFFSPPLWIVGSMTSMTLKSGSLGFPGLGKLHGAERHPCLRCM